MEKHQSINRHSQPNRKIHLTGKIEIKEYKYRVYIKYKLEYKLESNTTEKP